MKKFLKKIFHNNKKNKLPKTLTVGKNSILLDCTTFRFDVNSNNSIKIGEDCMIGCNFIFESDCGEIEIGDRTFINGGTNLISRANIKIGNDVTIAWGVTIYDHNSHSIDYRERQNDLKQQIIDYNNGVSFIKNKNWNSVKSRPIIIKDKVWIGFGVTILNGVTIGEGAIIGAESVVREDVEPWTIVYGNPARTIKRIKHD